ncbi:gamma-glutamyltransferase family protein [Galbitalea soli]|uniref:Transferase n=1 Tax=Galbitalea soli TaxID=1268042 RepID=A0A7C9TSA9_9MICO|nr:gamma-glutamyltransferase [Galbitalea soli]NEM92081.1 transferase [Galbitalea soli]NYJ31967.1 gamma-glutamyltranspeptidase/glutathione hydrolase [Galbitalea soli]
MSFHPAPEFTTRPTLRGTFGMAATTHWLASQSAMAVLERGGNAFDAAVAAGFVLQIVEPHLNGPGGDLVGLIAPADGEPRVLAGLGAAPRRASAEHYRELGLDLVPGAGLLAATAPGAVDAWLLLLRDRGTWHPEGALEFALHYAENGYPVLPAVTRTIETVAGLFADDWSTSAEQWLPGGAPLAAGSLHTRPEWAATLRRLLEAAQGDSREARIDAMRAEWRHGFVADAIGRFATGEWRDSSGERHAGVLTAEDVADYEATWEEPVRLDFRGHTVLKAGAWTQGPALLQALAILDGVAEEALDPSTALGAHTQLETLALVLADRDAWYGDDGSTPLDTLLSPDYAAARRTLIGVLAESGLRPGAPDDRAPVIPVPPAPPAQATAGSGEPTVGRDGVTRGDTCHMDVVDAAGNLVSVTPSGGWLQSSPHIPELGFCLGSRLQMTWLEEGHASTLRPGQRPRTTLSPTLVLGADGGRVALGTPGGDQQDQWQLPFLLRLLVGGYEPQQAIDAPSFHSTSANESFWPRGRVPAGATVESRLGEEVIAELILRGHDVTVAGPWSLGRLSAVGRGADGTLWAAANPRGMQGYAVGR